jgi:hypothetical protein
MKEANYAGIIIITAIAIMIGVGLLPTLGTYTGKMINTPNQTNLSVTTGANGAYVDLPGQELIGSYSINNHTLSTTSGAITSAGLSISEGVSSVTGYKRVRILTSNATWASKTVNVTYTYGEEGYVDDVAGRAIVPLIIVFFALLIMVVAIIPVFRNGFLEMINLR